MSEFKVDDQVTIRRGKHKGPGIVVLEADPSGQIAVKAHSGAILITNADNLKAPEEATVGAKVLSEAIAKASARDPERNNDGLFALLAALADEGVVPPAISWTHVADRTPA